LGNILKSILSYVLALVFILLTLFCIVLVASVPFYLMWNWLIPTIFGLPNITLIQSFGLWLMIFYIRNTKFDFKETMENIKSQQDNDEPIEWNQVLDSIKKNYMA
tara:strand:- start:55 stop:369 length:315 start_codon:yes stop_codon:yes gene_type:complete